MRFSPIAVGAFAAAVAAASAASAQYHAIAPNAFANVAGNSGINILIQDDPYTGQLIISSAQLSDITPGHLVTGITFRMSGSATNPYPPTAATWSDYSIWAGPSVSPADSTTTFADNFIGTPTLVRSGELTIPAGSFSAGGSPNDWGFELVFDTPFAYPGGHLTFEIRHTGSDIALPTGSFLDSAHTGSAGYGTDYRSIHADTYGATTGSATFFTISRLTVVVPEPGSLALLGLGGAMLLVRRRAA